MDKTLICAVKSAALSTTIKVFEPVAPQGKKKGGIGRLFRGDELIKVYQVCFFCFFFAFSGSVFVSLSYLF